MLSCIYFSHIPRKRVITIIYIYIYIYIYTEESILLSKTPVEGHIGSYDVTFLSSRISL